MEFRICLLSLFLATAFGLQDNLTVVSFSLASRTTFAPNSTSIKPTQTSGSVSFTVIPIGSTSATTVPHSSVTPTSTPIKPSQDMCYSFNYTKPSNSSCVKLCVQTQIILISNYTENKKSKNSTVKIPSPGKVTISGMCPVSINSKFDRSALYLKWAGKGDEKYELNITFLLNQKENSGTNGGLDKWFLETATYKYENISLITYSINVTKNSKTETITSDIRRAATCDKPLIMELNSEPNTIENGTMTWLNITRYTLQPFALNLTDFHFKFLDSCEPGGIPLFVPVVVAGILAGFVLILLIVYVIGRFRLKKKGEYERLT